jgi:hypothetical protein
VIVNYLHDTRVAQGVPRDHVYDLIFYVLATLLVAGFMCNVLIRPVRAKWHMEEEDGINSAASGQALGSKGTYGIGWRGLDPKTFIAWSACLGRVEDPRKRRENLAIADPGRPGAGLTLESSMSSTTPLGGRRPCTFRASAQSAS